MRMFMVVAFCLVFLIPGAAFSQESKPDWQRFIDEAEVRKVVDGIDWTCDAKDWPRCREFFADEIDVDFTSLVGGAPGHLKADALIEGWKTGLYQEKKSHHLRTNHQIEIKGDTAEVYSKGYALNILPRKTGSDLWEVWGDYHHSLKRTPKGWKVTFMQFTVVYARGNEKVREFVPESAR